MDRTLQPEDRIAHYRVVGPLAAGGGRAVSLASFPTGSLFEMCWLADGETVAFRYGTESVDAVLLRGFR